MSYPNPVQLTLDRDLSEVRSRIAVLQAELDSLVAKRSALELLLSDGAPPLTQLTLTAAIRRVGAALPGPVAPKDVAEAMTAQGFDWGGRTKTPATVVATELGRMAKIDGNGVTKAGPGLYEIRGDETAE